MNINISIFSYNSKSRVCLLVISKYQDWKLEPGWDSLQTMEEMREELDVELGLEDVLSLCLPIRLGELCYTDHLVEVTVLVPGRRCNAGPRPAVVPPKRPSK